MHSGFWPLPGIFSTCSWAESHRELGSVYSEHLLELHQVTSTQQLPSPPPRTAPPLPRSPATRPGTLGGILPFCSHWPATPHPLVLLTHFPKLGEVPSHTALSPFPPHTSQGLRLVSVSCADLGISSWGQNRGPISFILVQQESRHEGKLSRGHDLEGSREVSTYSAPLAPSSGPWLLRASGSASSRYTWGQSRARMKEPLYVLLSLGQVSHWS